MRRLLAVVAFFFATGVPIAHAAGGFVNFAPAPHFETACGGVPCNWAGNGPAVLTQDTSQDHSGSASAEITATGAAGTPGAVSDCFTGILGDTDYTVSGFYDPTGTGLSNISLQVSWRYDCANSTGLTTNVNTAPDTSPGFHSISGTVSAPTGANAAVIFLRYSCTSGTCANTAAVRFDDVALITTPLPTVAEVFSFAARRVAAGMRLSWHMGAKAGTLAYEVWRDSARLARVFASSRGTYRFVDRAARPGRTYIYRLAVLGPNGSRRFVATVRAGPG